jgi:uncharacterized protein (DUF488 family)
MPDELQIFTIGHSDHPLGSFVWLLRKHRIETLVDIRRFPGSKRHPQFSRESLSAALQDQGIEYLWLEALGGRRQRQKDGPPSPNEGLRHPSFRNYADYMLTDQFRQGVAKLLEMAEVRRTALMCAEALFWRCHRRLLSDCLTANGVAVEHIFPNGEVKPHTMTAEAKAENGIVTYPGQPTLFDMEGT